MTRAAGVQGYTVLRCSAAGCTSTGRGVDLAAQTLAAVRECVGSSRGGLLIGTGCVFGPSACRLRPPGPVLLVQACDADRKPTSPAVRVGPLRCGEDVRAVRDWLRAGDLDPGLLPEGLTELHRATRVAADN